MKKIIKAGFPIVITYLLNYIVILIAAMIYYLLGNHDVDIFINKVCPYIFIFYYIFIILYLYQKNKQQEPKPTKYFSSMYLGISIAVFLNMLIFKIIPSTNNTTSIAFPLLLINSGIIGPIYEEVLFRYLFYNRLKKIQNKFASFWITNLIFAVLHISPIKIVYAFLLGGMLTVIYEREKNIIIPIFTHIAANTIVLFLHEYNTYVLLLSLINLLLSIKINLNFK